MLALVDTCCVQFAGAYAGGGVHWVHVHPPPPHLGKKFRSEMSKRGEKVPPRYVGKKECARSPKIRQNENEKGRENKKIVKRKG